MRAAQPGLWHPEHGVTHLVTEQVLLICLHHARSLAAQGAHNALDVDCLPAGQPIAGVHSAQPLEGNSHCAQHA